MPRPSSPRKPRAVESGVAEVTSLSHDGRGVARVGGKAVFIEGALPGEEVSFAYLQRRKSYDSAHLTAVLRPSPERVAAPCCPYFGVCGGCSLQHLEPAAQLRAKQQVLLDALAHIGKVAPEAVLPPLTGPVWHYRRKARLGVRLVAKKGGVLVGFREKRRSLITPIATCEVLDARIAALLPALHELIAGLSCPDRIPQIEAAAGDDAVALVFRHLEPFGATDRTRLSAFAARHDVRVQLQAGGPETVTPLDPLGRRELRYTLPEQGIEIFFAPTDFVQVNAAINRQLVTRALELLDVQPGDRVLDLFCGVGNFTLPLARRAAEVTGIEGETILVERARENARRNGIGNARFERVDLYNADDAGAVMRRCDKLLLDPPRNGAIEAIKRLPAPGPSRVVYVSCNPATLARDAEALVHVHGYRLTGAGVADMFPHTTHVESIAVFERD